MRDIQELLIDDIKTLNSYDVGKLYKYVRRYLIAKTGMDDPLEPKNFIPDIWRNPDGSERYLTPEQYKAETGMEWIGPCWRYMSSGIAGWYLSDRKPSSAMKGELTLCAGNHGAPQDAWMP